MIEYTKLLKIHLSFFIQYFSYTTLKMLFVNECVIFGVSLPKLYPYYVSIKKKLFFYDHVFILNYGFY